MRRPLAATDRVLVRVPSWLGDLVQCEPALRALVERVGAERLSLAGDERSLHVFANDLPGVRRIVRSGHRGRGGETARAWRGHDVAILFTGSFRSAWIARAAGIPRRVGWARDARGWLLTDTSVPALERGGKPFGIGKVGGGRRYLPRSFVASCNELLGLVGVSVRETVPRLTVCGEALARVRDELVRSGLESGEPFALASIGGRTGSTKAFPPSAWARTADAFVREARIPVVLVCGPGEEPLLEEVRAATTSARVLAFGVAPRAHGTPGASGTRDAQGRRPAADLAELGALASLARVVLVADSGPRHVALAVGASIATVCGPTDPRHSADHLERQSVVRVEVPCGPCHAETCPLEGDEHHACMRRIDPVELAHRACVLGARVLAE